MTTEHSMIERVAQAISGGDDPEDILTIHRYRAKDAIQAMREPTEQMADAGAAAFLDATIAHEHGDKTNRPFVRFWRACIDAALKS